MGNLFLQVFIVALGFVEITVFYFGFVVSRGFDIWGAFVGRVGLVFLFSLFFVFAFASLSSIFWLIRDSRLLFNNAQS